MYQRFSLDECQRKSNIITHRDIPMHSSVNSEFHVVELLEHFGSEPQNTKTNDYLGYSKRKKKENCCIIPKMSN